jgi:hypothetical protein
MSWQGGMPGFSLHDVTELFTDDYLQHILTLGSLTSKILVTLITV